MNLQDEIKALREEVTKLRERVAVLEARPITPLHTLQFGPGHLSSPYQPSTLPPSISPPWTITCSADARQ